LAEEIDVMVTPPVEITHTESPVAGSKVHFEYGWVSMTARGLINHAEHMRESAEGWSHVDARVRDHAFNMLDCGLDISYDMVLKSEIILRSFYESDDAFLEARAERGEREAHYIMPRPVKPGVDEEAPLPIGEYFFPSECENRDGASGSGGSDMQTWTASSHLEQRNIFTCSKLQQLHINKVVFLFIVQGFSYLFLTLNVNCACRNYSPLRRSSPASARPSSAPPSAPVTVGRVSTARLLGMCGNHG
jgi:hypothetical protein